MHYRVVQEQAVNCFLKDSAIAFELKCIFPSKAIEMFGGGLHLLPPIACVEETISAWFRGRRTPRGSTPGVVLQGSRESVPPRLCPYMIGPRHVCAHTRLCPHTFVPSHVCAHTRWRPNTFVPTHVSDHTPLCPHTFVPRHVCA